MGSGNPVEEYHEAVQVPGAMSYGSIQQGRRIENSGDFAMKPHRRQEQPPAKVGEDPCGPPPRMFSMPNGDYKNSAIKTGPLRVDLGRDESYIWSKPQENCKSKMAQGRQALGEGGSFPGKEKSILGFAKVL